MVEKRIKYSNLKKYKGGIVWVKNNNKRIEIAIKILRHLKNEWEHVVWIANAGYVDNPEYQANIKQKLRNLCNKVHFFSYEDISLINEMYVKIFELACKKNVFCVLDRSLNLKNMVTARTKRMLVLRKKFKYRLLLSELPIYRAIRDIYAQLMFICSSAVNKTETQFLHQYMPYYTDDFEVSKRWSLPDLERKVIKKIRPFILFYDFSDDLKINHFDCEFELSEAEKKEYLKDKIEFLKDNPKAAYLKIIQRFQYYYTICRQKVDKLRLLLDEKISKNEKVLIYMKYLSEVKFLRESGLLANHKFVIMTGMNDKNRAVKMFENDHNIMICTYKVDIPKLFLKECCNLIYFSQTFDYKDKMYALSRFRGYDGLVLNIYDFWVNTQLENLIKDNLKRKKDVLENIVNIMSNKKVGD